MAIMNQVRDTVETDITDGVGFSYSKEGSAKLFMMMSDYLYSDKEYAVISELGANAYDAHAMVGKQDVPFSVFLPTALSNEFCVRDYGPGMSEEDVYRFLTQYGETSKSGSNDQVGFWGIGSKSPAAVSDTWSVISYHGGKKMHFEVFITEQGIPTLKKIFETVSEETGLEIRIPLAQTNYNTWKAACVKAFTYYKVKPKLNIEVSYPLVKYVDGVGSDLWSFRKDQYGYNTPHIITTMRRYSIDLNKIVTGLLADDVIVKQGIASKFFQRLDMTFDIGQIDLNISREQIQYTPKTVSAIRDRLRLAFNEFSKAVNDSLSATTTHVEFKKKLYDWYTQTNLTKELSIIADKRHGVENIPSDLQYIRFPIKSRTASIVAAGNKLMASRSRTQFGVRVSESWNRASSTYEYILSININDVSNIILVVRDVHDSAARAAFSGDQKKTYVIVEEAPNVELPIVMGSSFERKPKEKVAKNLSKSLNHLYILRYGIVRRIKEDEYNKAVANKNRVAIVKIEDARIAGNQLSNNEKVKFLVSYDYTILAYKQDDKVKEKFDTVGQALEKLYVELKNAPATIKDLEQHTLDDAWKDLRNSSAGLMVMMFNDDLTDQWKDIVAPVAKLIGHPTNSPVSNLVSGSVRKFRQLCSMLDKKHTFSHIDANSVIESVKARYPMLAHITWNWYVQPDSELYKAATDYVKFIDNKSAV